MTDANAALNLLINLEFLYSMALFPLTPITTYHKLGDFKQ